MLTNTSWIKSIVVVTCLLAAGCTRKWEEHNAPGDAIYVNNNLYQQIAANASLARFAGFLKQTGYADTISLSRTFTVWAPTDEALKNLDAAVVNDAARLKQFVAHHIAVFSFRTSDVQKATTRVGLMDGKYGTFAVASFEDAAIVAANGVAANGILHTISGAAVSRGNCWDYVDSLKAGGLAMAAYLRDNQYKARDLTNAEQIGVDPGTGEPIYKPGTDSVWLNKFTNEVYNLNREDSVFTVFVLANTAFDAERVRFAPFYATGTADSTANLAQWNTVKDLVIPGAYAPEQLPDTIVSKYGVKVAVNKSAVTRSYKTSNGYVYVVNEMPVTLEQKFPDFIVQGENYTTARVMPSGSIFTRTLVDSFAGGTFRDVFVYKHGINQFYVGYRLNNVYTTTYKVYWRVINNTGLLAHPYVQRLAMGRIDNTATFAYTNITPYNYNEVYLGEYKVANYGNGVLSMYLVSANITPSGSNHNQNALLLDYLRLVPTR